MNSPSGYIAMRPSETIVYRSGKGLGRGLALPVWRDLYHGVLAARYHRAVVFSAGRAPSGA